MKQLRSITIEAEISGNIWMPMTECTKEVKQVFTPDNIPFTKEWINLREALLDITNDGDFRSCAINWAWIEVKWVDERGKQSAKAQHINPGKFVSDLFN